MMRHQRSAGRVAGSAITHTHTHDQASTATEPLTQLDTKEPDTKEN